MNAAEQSVEEKAILFPAGLYGFPDVKRFVVSEIPGGGDFFKSLIALERPEVAFTLAYPFAFFADYAPDIPDAELEDLGASKPEDVLVMVIANVPERFRDTTVNLKAPVLFNPHTRKGRQVILQDDRYTTRHRLFKAE